MSVVIPTCGRARYLDRQLAALTRQETAVPFEVIVADNGCDPGVLASLAESFSRLDLRIIDATARPGRCFARNHGARSARSGALLFLDHDDEAAPGYVGAMACALGHHPVVAACIDLRTLNPAWLTPPGAHAHDVLTTPGPPPWILTGAMGIDRAVFEGVGGFDEAFRLCYEDVDLCWRLHRLGYPISVVPDAVLHYRLRAGGKDALLQSRRTAIGLVQLGRKYPGADRVHFQPRPQQVPRWLCASILRILAGRTPHIRWTGWRGVGTCIGRIEAQLRDIFRHRGPP